MARGFIVHPTYRVREGVPVVQLYGRLDSGESFRVEDDRFRPYFFVPRGDEEILGDARDVILEHSSLHDLRGRPVVRVQVPLPGDVPRLRERLRAAGGEALEADVRFPYRYLIDRDIRATLEIHGRGEQRADGEVLFRNPELSAAPAKPRLRSLSLDLETTADASRIFAAALVGCGVEEVHLVASGPVAGAITHPEEPALLFALLERIRALDPDLLLGWNVIDFDLRVILNRCQALHIPPLLGRDRELARVFEDGGPRRQSRADVPGRMVLDGIPMVRDALRLPDYRLETVAQHVLGRGKKIDNSAIDKAEEILRMFREQPEDLVAYNLEDARLVPEILEKEGLLELAVERSKLSGMQLDRVGASIASFDRLYLPELRRRGRVAPCVEAERKQEQVRGGALLEPQPGLHRDVAVLDFKSLYPSLIRTFHLDPLARARATDSDAVVAPNGARFSRDEAILPGVLERFMASRDEAKARGDRHADQAIKIMMNALFGVLGAGSCRFFDPEIANAITGFGQQTLAWTREAFEEAGVRVLYGDTDSVFVELPANSDRNARDRSAGALRDRVQERLSARIRASYQVVPRLELELERIFDRLYLPRLRGGRSGSKKRYAGLVEDQLVIVGLESVRRDWPAVAHRLQEGLLERLFRDRDPIPFTRELVERMRNGELDAELVYNKRLRKRSLDGYAANAPHVQAARKAGSRAGRTIRYVITQTGPEPVFLGEPLPAGIDRSHYVEKVLRPIAEGILAEAGSSFDEALGAPTQLPLL